MLLNINKDADVIVHYCTVMPSILADIITGSIFADCVPRYLLVQFLHLVQYMYIYIGFIYLHI